MTDKPTSLYEAYRQLELENLKLLGQLILERDRLAHARDLLQLALNALGGKHDHKG